LIALSNDLQARGVDLVVLDQGIDTSTAVGRMFFQILGAIAEFEHALMTERTRDGLDAARARGRTGGQKPKLTTRQAKMAQDMYDELGAHGRRAYTVQQIAEEFGVTRPTIHRHLQHATDGPSPSGPRSLRLAR
jgi:DNA invertase Pin-like site-specific DNA recombinase